MAFSQSVIKGQYPVGCQLCEGNSKIQWKCIDCELLMCTKCKDRIHPKFKKATDHKIIDIKDVGSHEERDKITFSDSKCEEHTDQSCCVFCSTCKKCVCVKCITKIHNGHEFLDEEEYDIQRHRLMEGQREADKSINSLNTSEEKIQNKKKIENSKYENAKQAILDQKKGLIGVVNLHSDKLLEELDQKWASIHCEIDKEHVLVRNTRERLQKKTGMAEELLNSNDFKKFFGEVEGLEIDLKQDIKTANLEPISMPQFIPGEILKYNVGLLKTETSLEEVIADMELYIARQFTTDLKYIHYIAAAQDGTLWIADNLSKSLKQIRLRKDGIEVKSKYRINIFDIAIISSDEILLSTGGTCLQFFSGKNGEMRDSEYNVAPLKITTLHKMKDGRVIVAAAGPSFPETERAVIFVMDQTGKLLEEYEFDKNKKRIFTNPKSVSSTKFGNICIADKVAINFEGRVVVVGRGNILNFYTGNPMGTPFTPVGVLVTPSDRIIVTDMYHNKLHILNSLGEFIRIYNTKDFGIEYPYSLALTTNGKLFVGCVCELRSSDEVKAKLYEIGYTGL